MHSYSFVYQKYPWIDTDNKYINIRVKNKIQVNLYIRMFQYCFCLTFWFVVTVYNIMIVKEKIKLSDYAQSLNVSSYNQKDRATPFRKRKSNSTSIHNYSFSKMRASTAMSDTQPAPEERCKSVEKQMTDQQTYDKSRANHDNHKKRRHITDCQNHSYGMSLLAKNSEKEINKNQETTERKKSEVGTFLQSKRSTIGPISITSKVNYAKKSKTGKQLVLNNSHFQSWINEVLLQNCNEKFDRTINLCAVKKYMIDSASLSTFGISEADVIRIYRSLHVYSVGFSKLIKEIKGVSAKAYRNVWKVYSILLQHCSMGDYQTMMSEIESENTRKLEKLEDELQEKQDIIEQNDELNRQKNSKIFKEIKVLKDENFQLILQKDVINNDCREFEKAFNEEVSLRMLFQQKINSIYCVYNELSNKHSVLYKDFHAKSTEVGLLLQENKKIAEENSKVKKEMYGVLSDNTMMSQELAQLKEQLARLQHEQKKRSTQESDAKLHRLNISKQLVQAQQERKKMAKGVQIIEDNNKLLRQTYHMLQLEYQQCLNQNRRLLSTLDEQTAIHNRYFQDRKKLDRGLVNYENEKGVYQNKIEDRQKVIDELKNKIKGLQDKIDEMQSESEFAEQNINKFNEDVALAEQNISKLKAINNENQRIIEEQQTKIITLETQLRKSVRQKQHSEGTSKQHEQRINLLDNKNKTLVSELQILKQKLAADSKARQKAKEIELAERKKDERELNFLRKDCLSKQLEVDKLKEAYENTMLQLKNERFEKKNLELSYKQCLTVIDNYTKVITDINTKHSDLENKLQQVKRTKKLIELNYENQIKRLNSANKVLSEKTKELTQFSQKHKDCIHPMIYQDLVARLQRLHYKQLQREEMFNTLQQITREGEQKYQSTLIQREKELTQLNTKLKHTQEKLTFQIQYEKKKYIELSKDLQNVELQLVALKSNYKAPVQQFREKERRYLEIIREKKQKFECLIDEIEVMHDQNHKLMEQITYTQKQLTTHRQKLTDVQQDLLVMQNQKQKAESQRDEAIHQVNEIKRQFKLDIPESLSPNGQSQDLIRKSSSGKYPNVYLRQRTKSIGQRTVEVHREGRNIEDQNHNEPATDQKTNKRSNIREKDRREDFAHKFKNASHYYLK